MREIKFRAWDESISKYIEWGELLKSDAAGRSYYGLRRIFSGENYHYHLEQFTGLHDKNGKEIYENDIVFKAGTKFMKPVIDVVTMDRFPVYWLKSEDFGYEGEELEDSYNFEVIGNIHENPELIEAK